MITHYNYFSLIRKSDLLLWVLRLLLDLPVLKICFGWKGAAKDAKARKLAFQHWIEAIDSRHRLYYEEWCNGDAGQPFFYWLDIVVLYSLDSISPHFELFHAAYTGKLNRFKRLALDHAKGEGIAVDKSIGEVVDECGPGSLHIAAEGGSLNVCKYLLETLKLDVDSKDKSDDHDHATCATPTWIGKGPTCVCFKRKGAYERICINLTPLQTISC
ncbi:hypothetical protein MKW98_015316 [Papaver atlanticum]|uniref:Uncharacterized protein n=1 Tax=Papaver atlanticum TaxID=357466 RepID=A0AAD4T566_9MAGN|nr:hypothetical protein MKW98_015316 [Papaver atlanticum]